MSSLFLNSYEKGFELLQKDLTDNRLMKLYNMYKNKFTELEKYTGNINFIKEILTKNLNVSYYPTSKKIIYCIMIDVLILFYSKHFIFNKKDQKHLLCLLLAIKFNRINVDSDTLAFRCCHFLYENKRYDAIKLIWGSGGDENRWIVGLRSTLNLQFKPYQLYNMNEQFLKFLCSNITYPDAQLVRRSFLNKYMNPKTVSVRHYDLFNTFKIIEILNIFVGNDAAERLSDYIFSIKNEANN